jgi:hypothetical protein
MNSRKRFGFGKGSIESYVCGLHLRSIVGLERSTIEHLDLDLEFIGIKYINIIAQFAASTLFNLTLWWFKDQDVYRSSECFEALSAFLNRCDGIRNLKLVYFDFGYDPTAISQAVKDGVCRLNQLDLLNCRGDIRMFVENAPIPNLKILRYDSPREAEEDYGIISAIATSYRTLVSVRHIARFESSASLLKIVEYCRDLERVNLHTNLQMQVGR